MATRGACEGAFDRLNVPEKQAQFRSCSREDSNLHGFPHTVLSRTRLPVPPRERGGLNIADLMRSATSESSKFQAPNSNLEPRPGLFEVWILEFGFSQDRCRSWVKRRGEFCARALRADAPCALCQGNEAGRRNWRPRSRNRAAVFRSLPPTS